MEKTELTPELIFEEISTKSETPTTSICTLHNPCHPNPKCTSIQQTMVLNFDRIESNWHQKKKEPNTDSVDALTYTSNKLCMVELKGWKSFLEHQNISHKEKATGHEKEILNKRIDKQNQKYKLQDKLLESISLCEEIIGIKDIKQLVSILYILVTDINPYQNAISSLTQQLNMLANTATDWETVCASKMSQHFTNETKTIKGIKTALIYCKEFDKFIKTIDSKGNTQSKEEELQEISQ